MVAPFGRRIKDWRTLSCLDLDLVNGRRGGANNDKLCFAGPA
jgi:hypothetical protein